MAFYRTKTVKGIKYTYLVERVWQDGTVRQQVLFYLGRFKSAKAAFRHRTREAHRKNSPKAKAAHARKMVGKLKKLREEGKCNF